MTTSNTTQVHDLTLIRNNIEHDVEVTVAVHNYIYGMDADGNRGEKRVEWEVTKATSPTLILGPCELEEIDTLLEEGERVYDYEN